MCVAVCGACVLVLMQGSAAGLHGVAAIRLWQLEHV